jgi:hypothetical protein
MSKDKLFSILEEFSLVSGKPENAGLYIISVLLLYPNLETELHFVRLGSQKYFYPTCFVQNGDKFLLHYYYYY